MSGLIPSTIAYLSASLLYFDVTSTTVGGLIPPVPASIYSALVSSLGTLCSNALLLAAALPVTLTVKSTTALLANWQPPQGASSAALACIVGYRVSLAPCVDSGAQGACQTITSWDSGTAVQGIQAYSASDLPFAAFAPAAPYIVPGSSNLSSGLIPASSDTKAYLQYALTGLTTLKWYKVAVQVVDRDGNTNYAPSCTLATTTTCATAQSPKRPLRNVTIGAVGQLYWGTVRCDAARERCSAGCGLGWARALSPSRPLMAALWGACIWLLDGA